MRGGGSSGKIGYPGYMQTQHTSWLTSVAALIANEVVGAGPYNTAFAYDPDTDLGDYQTEIDAFDTAIDAVSPATDYDTYFDAAAATVDAGLLPDSYIDTLATEYEATQQPSYFRSLNRITGGMSDLNAVHTSAFVISLAIAEESFQTSISLFTANMKAQRDKLRTVAVLDGVKSIMHLVDTALQGNLNVAQLQGDYLQKSVTFKSNQYEQDLAIDVHDIMWDFDLYMRGGEMLGSISGAASGPLKTPRIGAAAGGAMSGFANMAMTGGMMGGAEGAILAGLLGGGIGALGGLFG